MAWQTGFLYGIVFKIITELPLGFEDNCFIRIVSSYFIISSPNTSGSAIDEYPFQKFKINLFFASGGGRIPNAVSILKIAFKNPKEAYAPWKQHQDDLIGLFQTAFKAK